MVVVTGGTAGVGRATARRFARSGAAVAVLARGHTGLTATREELEALGVRALALCVDVADADAVRAAAETVERTLGPITTWINNAMTTVYARITDIEPSEFRRVTEVTYLGYVWGTQAALSVMRPRNQGTIVQVGSSLAYRAIPLQSAYCGAKHAIRAFTDALRSELIHDRMGIHVTMVQLPAVNTPQFDHCLSKMGTLPQPVPPCYQPEVAAEAIFHATRQRLREVYVTPSTIKAIVAQKLVPGLVDHYVARKVWDGQLSPEPLPSGHQSNLFAPVEGRDAGAHGRFDDSARTMDLATALTLRLGAGGVRALALAAPLMGAGYLLGSALARRFHGRAASSAGRSRARLAPKEAS